MFAIMKRVAAVYVAVALVASGAGCASSSRSKPPLLHHSEFSTATRLWDGRNDIEHREEILKRKGLTEEDARRYAEIEYLKSRAGSPLR
jgi:Spy/CpxP family protein refolding chaperone